MDVRRLEAFCKVYELGSFSKAGQQLFLSQPTISAHVSLLEQELGAPLFDRLGRAVLPTPAGKALYGHARRVFDALREARAEIELLREQITGELVVGGSTIPATYLLPPLLARFQARHVGVQFRLATGDSEAILERILSGELAVGVVGAREDEPDLAFEPLLRDELVIVTSPEMARRLAGQDDPVRWPWVTREPGSGTRRALETGLRQAGRDWRELRVIADVESNEAAMQCARSGLGVTVSSRLAAGSLLRSGELVEIKAEALTMERAFYVAHGVRRHVFPVYRAFIDFLRQDGAQAVQAGQPAEPMPAGL